MGIREIRLVLNDDGTADLRVLALASDMTLRWYHREFSENEEIGDIRQYIDGGAYRTWPHD